MHSVWNQDAWAGPVLASMSNSPSREDSRSSSPAGARGESPTVLAMERAGLGLGLFDPGSRASVARHGAANA